MTPAIIDIHIRRYKHQVLTNLAKGSGFSRTRARAMQDYAIYTAMYKNRDAIEAHAQKVMRDVLHSENMYNRFVILDMDSEPQPFITFGFKDEPWKLEYVIQGNKEAAGYSRIYPSVKGFMRFEPRSGRANTVRGGWKKDPLGVYVNSAESWERGYYRVAYFYSELNSFFDTIVLPDMIDIFMENLIEVIEEETPQPTISQSTFTTTRTRKDRSGERSGGDWSESDFEETQRAAKSTRTFKSER